MRVVYVNGKKTLNFGYCKVVEDKDNFYGIYRRDKLLMHKSTWRQATKIASLLEQAYDDGYKDRMEDEEYNEMMRETW